jgi:hypothetical protein
VQSTRLPDLRGFSLKVLDMAGDSAFGGPTSRLRPAGVRLKPVGDPPRRGFGVDIARDMRRRLASGPLAWDLELQFFVDEATTPIDDGTKAWPDAETPILTVARLTLESEATVDLETATFDPWRGLVAHRPLVEVMRARKVAYSASQKGRAA